MNSTDFVQPVIESWFHENNCWIDYNLMFSRYVQHIKERALPGNSVDAAQRQLKMMKRIVIMSFFTPPPKYHFRITHIFIDIKFAFTTIISYENIQITNKSNKTNDTKF